MNAVTVVNGVINVKCVIPKCFYDMVQNYV